MEEDDQWNLALSCMVWERDSQLVGGSHDFQLAYLRKTVGEATGILQHSGAMGVSSRAWACSDGSDDASAKALAAVKV